MKYPNQLLTLINHLKKLPGVGGKSAERFAFELLDWPHPHIEQFADSLKRVMTELKNCPECGSICAEKECMFCNSPSRDQTTICIVAGTKDVFNIESTHEYKGLFHVLGGTLSPLDDKTIHSLTFNKLMERIHSLNIQEAIIALDSTLEGDTTSLHLKQELERINIKVSRLAFGLPMGSALEYVDKGTLTQAFLGRQSF